MKLITLSCPKCSAQLQINEQLNHAICNYCGYHFLVDDEAKRIEIQNPRQVGRELELGRRSVRGGNQELAQEVLRIKEPLSAINHNTSQAEALKRQMSGEKSAGIAFVILAAVVVILFLGVSIQLAFEQSKPGHVGTGIVASFFFGGIPFLVGFLFMRSSKNKKARCEEHLKAIEKAKAELQETDISIIPPAYRNIYAIDFIYQALINQRAMTMQEAVNLYEQEMHNNRMETIQRVNAQANLINAELNAIKIKSRL